MRAAHAGDRGQLAQLFGADADAFLLGVRGLLEAGDEFIGHQVVGPRVAQEAGIIRRARDGEAHMDVQLARQAFADDVRHVVAHEVRVHADVREQELRPRLGLALQLHGLPVLARAVQREVAADIEVGQKAHAVLFLQPCRDGDEFGDLHVEHGLRPRVETLGHALPAGQHHTRYAERGGAQQFRDQRDPIPVAAAELHDRVGSVRDDEARCRDGRQVQASRLVIGQEYAVDVLAQQRHLCSDRLGIGFGPQEQLGRDHEVLAPCGVPEDFHRAYLGNAGHAGDIGATKITQTATRQETFARAAALLRAGEAAAAAEACERALAVFSADGNLLCLAARANLVLRNFELARRQVDSALGHYPEFAEAHDVLGDLLLVGDDAEGALSAYTRALELDPGLRQTQIKSDKARELAATMPRRARRGRLARFAADLRQAEQHERDGERDKAEAIYRKILRADPEHVDAARALAGIAMHHERYAEAEVFLEKAVELAPDFARAWVDLANVQRQLDKHGEALTSARRVLELTPGKPEAFMLLGTMLGSAGDHEAAIRAFEQVLEIDPRRSGALLAMAHHLKTVGRQQDAIDRYRQCLALQPDNGEAWWSLANLKTFRFRDEELESMSAELGKSDLPDEARLQIHNALGFAFEARTDFDRAFEHFAACNAIRRPKESYDPVDTESTHDRVIELFDEDFLAQAGGGEVSPVPIFVVGLPRSGSTLIEQILASHSRVEGTHELSDLSKVVRDLRRGAPAERRFPDSVAQLGTAGWSRLGQDYLARTAQYRSAGSPCFIDKNPNNFVFAGLIRLALPNARVINACRHPLDSCLGTYKQLFASGQPFSYDLVEARRILPAVPAADGPLASRHAWLRVGCTL